MTSQRLLVQSTLQNHFLNKYFRPLSDEIMSTCFLYFHLQTHTHSMTQRKTIKDLKDKQVFPQLGKRINFVCLFRVNKEAETEKNIIFICLNVFCSTNFLQASEKDAFLPFSYHFINFFFSPLAVSLSSALFLQAPKKHEKYFC